MQHRDKFPSQSENKATSILELVDLDLVNPLLKASFHGSKYFVVYIDDYP
jgi:hypothetical protein